MKIATAPSKTSKRWRTQDVSWDWLLDRLRTVKRTGETVAEYRRMSKDDQAARKDVGGFVGGALTGGRRVKGAVKERWLVTLDADDGAEVEAWDDMTSLYDWRMAVYSTHSHTPERPRLRWIIPLRRAVSPEEYPAVARRLAEWIGIETMDPTTYEPERMMFWPSAPEDAEYIFHEQDGPVLDPDVVLRTYGASDAWKDTSLWPISKREQAVVVREAQRQGDPETKPGLVGKFCRAYDVPSAIDRWLPNVYELCEMGNSRDRYTYTGGSTSGGAVLYDGGKFLYSHHATDPAGGTLCNAFDLVRLHLFGAQDEGHEQKDITQRPSYRAMCDMVTRDPECRKAFFAETQAEAMEQFADLVPEQTANTLKENIGKSADFADNSSEKGADNSDWLSELEVNRKTGEADSTISNATLILRNDPMLRGAFGINEFSMRPVLRRSLPWRRAKDGDPWTDADDANLLLYMEKRWKFSGEAKIRNAWTVVANENAFHPVRDYLNGLVWDGTERLDTMLIRYMAAEDTPYVRAVTRKWMVGAVKRVMQPGCKFDQMLILVGAQGIGKSRLAIVLSRGWFTDSITRMDGKEAYESIRGAWIVEVAELAATRKSEQEAQKQFISAQTDMYRPAYGRNVVVYPRQCVFYGTTNDLEPLKDDTGARRYWPVMCAGKDDGQHFGLEEEVDQLWAEAVVRYKAGESLWLDDKALASDAKEVQDVFSGRDEWIGIIQDYLDIPLPLDWYERTPEQRRAYINGDTLEDQEKNTMRRDVICVTEVRMELFEESKGGRSGGDSTSRRIAKIVANLPGWERAHSPRRVPGYGMQKVLVRK